ncbi:MAG: alpha/beta fold hydrolase [Caulobacteraceae bacterium]
MRAAIITAAAAIFALALGGTAARAAPAEVIRTDHHVPVKSTAPGMAGGQARLYVREVRLRGAAKPKGIVLFIHGAGTPAEVSFDVPYADYSWMAYLARAGFDVFAMDMEGYGRSTRPPPMADACNAPAAAQAQFVPKTIPAPCPASFKGPITTMGSDWTDIGAVVDNLLAMRGQANLSIVAWSQGGPRSFGFALANPAKVARIVALAPAYIVGMPTLAPDPLPPVAAPVTTQSEAEFKANWDRQAPCPGQYEPAAAASVWSEMMKSDPVGATWGPGVRRAPSVPSWGFNKETAPRMATPYLMVAGASDAQVNPALVRQLYEDLGSKDKVLIDLACSSHNAMWEKNHLLLFKASADWLANGKVEGMSMGVVRMGY